VTLPPTDDAPLVRAVVVNFNGGELTLDCLGSLLATDWPSDRLEVVLVDNASGDGSVQAVRARHPSVRVIESPDNVGFGGGCNLALTDLGAVDHVALVNNDATVASGWLGPLVQALASDVSIGAACPKILFAESFVDVHVESATRVRGRGDPRELGVRVSGLRVDGAEVLRRAQLVDGFWGLEYGGAGEGRYTWTAGRSRLRVPVGAGRPLPEAAEVRLASDAPTPAVLHSLAGRVDVTVESRPRWFRVPLAGPAYDVVNSAGSVLEGDHGADRGYLEPDRGQYDEPVDVFAWSGAAVLLSRRYLDEVGLFDPHYFLYYEDLDLAWRGRRRGWRYRYVPESVVRHVHSAASDDGSKLFAFYNERNRLLTLARNAGAARAGRAVFRSLLVTASYARRDIASPLLRGRRPHPDIVSVRLRALASFGRLLPGTLAARGG
jgi:GT2 family glycosyltransferase